MKTMAICENILINLFKNLNIQINIQNNNNK